MNNKSNISELRTLEICTIPPLTCNCNIVAISTCISLNPWQWRAALNEVVKRWARVPPPPVLPFTFVQTILRKCFLLSFFEMGDENTMVEFPSFLPWQYSNSLQSLSNVCGIVNVLYSNFWLVNGRIKCCITFLVFVQYIEIWKSV